MLPVSSQGSKGVKITARRLLLPILHKAGQWSRAPLPFFMSQRLQLSRPKYGQISCSRNLWQSFLLLGGRRNEECHKGQIVILENSFPVSTLVHKLPVCPEVLKTNGTHLRLVILTDWAWKCKFTPWVSSQMLPKSAARLTERFHPVPVLPGPAAAAPRSPAPGSRGCSCTVFRSGRRLPGFGNPGFTGGSAQAVLARPRSWPGLSWALPWLTLSSFFFLHPDFKSCWTRRSKEKARELYVKPLPTSKLSKKDL